MTHIYNRFSDAARRILAQYYIRITRTHTCMYTNTSDTQMWPWFFLFLRRSTTNIGTILHSYNTHTHICMYTNTSDTQMWPWFFLFLRRSTTNIGKTLHTYNTHTHTHAYIQIYMTHKCDHYFSCFSDAARRVLAQPHRRQAVPWFRVHSAHLPQWASVWFYGGGVLVCRPKGGVILCVRAHTCDSW